MNINWETHSNGYQVAAQIKFMVHRCTRTAAEKMGLNIIGKLHSISYQAPGWLLLLVVYHLNQGETLGV